MLVFALYNNLLNQEVFIVMCTKKYCEFKLFLQGHFLGVFGEYVHGSFDEGHLCETNCQNSQFENNIITTI